MAIADGVTNGENATLVAPTEGHDNLDGKPKIE